MHTEYDLKSQTATFSQHQINAIALKGKLKC